MDDNVIDMDNFINLSNSEIDWINETVSTSLSYAFIYMEADRAIDLFTRFKASDYANISTIVQEIEFFIAEMNTKFRKAKVEKTTERVFSLKDESFISVIQDVYTEINSKYRKLITGMQGVNQLVGGGFENTRVYLFLGLTGIGKSMTLLNLAYQIKRYNKNFKPKDPTKIPCIVYLTMENTVTETVQRLFQMCVGQNVNMKDYTIDEVIHILKTTGELFLTDESPIDIIIKFKPNRSEDTGYLYTLTEDLEDEGYEVICMIQDHVKRIKAATSQQDIRLELGDVINEMKTFAMIKDIPVITVSHLNRDGARVIDSSSSTKTDLTRMLGKANIGESLLMLDNVDFAGILNNEYDSEGHKYMVFKGIKYRFKVIRDYICQPFVPDNDVKLIEDYYSPVPLFKETLRSTPTLNQEGAMATAPKVRQTGYSSNIQNMDNKNDNDTILEFVKSKEVSIIDETDNFDDDIPGYNNPYQIIRFVS